MKIDIKPNFIVNSLEDIMDLSKVYRCKKLPDAIKQNVIAWHNSSKYKDKHLVRFGDCTNVYGATCIKCDCSMWDWGGYAGDTQTMSDEYFEPCKRYSRHGLIMQLLKVVETYDWQSDAEWLNDVFEEFKLTTEEGRKFFNFYSKNRQLIEKDENGKIIGFENRPEEYIDKNKEKKNEN
jgi:hypothetical protein